MYVAHIYIFNKRSIIPGMDIEFKDPDHDRLEIDPRFDAGFEMAVVKSYRKKIFFIRNAVDERDFYAMKSLHFEKLKGDRSGQFSMRLNDKWRLILEFKHGQSGKIVVVVSIEDYH
jgi:proteic killer suppression protein